MTQYKYNINKKKDVLNQLNSNEIDLFLFRKRPISRGVTVVSTPQLVYHLSKS